MDEYLNIKISPAWPIDPKEPVVSVMGWKGSPIVFVFLRHTKLIHVEGNVRGTVISMQN